MMVTAPLSSSRPDIPARRKIAVRRPPMIADTSAVSAVLRTCPSPVLAPRSRGPDTELGDGPSVYPPLAAFLHEPPYARVSLDLVGKCSLGLAGDCRRAA